MSIFRDRHRSLERSYPLCTRDGVRGDRDGFVRRHENAATVAIYNILFTNDIVSGYLNDALSEFSRSPLCRFERKRLVRQAQRMRLDYERRIHGVIRELAEFFGDAADRFTDLTGIGHDIDILYWSLKQAFDDHGVENAALLARLETARALVDVSVQQHAWRMEELAGLDGGFRSLDLSYLRMDDVCRVMGLLLGTFLVERDVDVNTGRVKSALDVVVRKFADIHAIGNSITRKRGAVTL